MSVHNIMEKKNGFYVTLPSNASTNVYPNNKIWNYRTKLAKPIVLNEPYEVGLIEVQYPRNWITFPSSDAEVSVVNMKTNKETVLTLAQGHYDTVQRIVKEFNSKCIVNSATSRISLHYNYITNHIFVTGAEGLAITFRGRLAEILGFEPGNPFIVHDVINFKKPSAAPYPADIYGGSYNIFIYTDIVDYQLVGNSYVPLLRCINVSDEERHTPTLSYDKPHYTSLSKSVIDDIEISLKNDQNKYIPFQYGKVIIKLHFRPVSRSF